MKAMKCAPVNCEHARIEDVPSYPTANNEHYPSAQPQFERCFECGCTRLKAFGLAGPGAWRLPWAVSDEP